MNPILEKALDFLLLRINTEEFLSNPNDRDKAIRLFKILHIYGIPLDAEEIENLALSRGLSQGLAHELDFLARQIAGGMKVELFDIRYAYIAIPDDIVERLSKEIEDEGS